MWDSIRRRVFFFSAKDPIHRSQWPQTRFHKQLAQTCRTCREHPQSQCRPGPARAPARSMAELR